MRQLISIIIIFLIAAAVVTGAAYILKRSLVEDSNYDLLTGGSSLNISPSDFWISAK